MTKLQITNKINALYSIKLEMKRSIRFQRQLGKKDDPRIPYIKKLEKQIDNLLQKGEFPSVNKALQFRRENKSK